MTQSDLDRIKSYCEKATVHDWTREEEMWAVREFAHQAIKDLPLLVAEVERLQEQCIIKNRIDKLDELQSALSAAQKRIDELEQWRRGAGPCKLCGEPTDSLAGNPDRWSIMLPFPGGDGKDAPHHIGCVLDKMYNTPPKEP